MLLCCQLSSALPEGDKPFQFYSLATPNGQKPAILLEELDIEYDAHKIIINGEQFTSGFVDINPNSKIPAALDKEGTGGKAVRLFESGQCTVSGWLGLNYPLSSYSSCS